MWLLDYFCKQYPNDFKYEDILLKYDSFLSRAIPNQWQDIDPMHGLLSTATYLLARKSEESKQCLKHILNMLEMEKSVAGNGIFWKTSNADRSNPDKSHVNFGYAHGLLAILFFISKFIEKDIEKEKCVQLLKKGVDFFLSYKDFNGEMYFPTRIEDGVTTKNLRLAYCYGDLGIAVGLATIGKLMANKQLTDLSKDLAINAAKISVKHPEYVTDIGLCHGAAGNAYMFDKLYKIHKVSILNKAAVGQYNKLLELQIKGTGIAGYTSRDYDNQKESFYQKTDPGFINGVSGLGLSIISFLKPKADNKWDSILYFR